MCLNLNKYAEKQITSEDIVCYKRVNVDYYSNIIQYQGKSFTGIIYDVECEGVIQVEFDKAYFCTNNSKLNGFSCVDKLGYLYSWGFDDTIQSIIIDGIDVMDGSNCIYFETPYQYAEVKLGETYTSELIRRRDNTIEIGLHSFTTYEDARRDGDSGVVVKCIIPKGSEYYLGHFCGDPSYASNKIKYLEIVEE